MIPEFILLGSIQGSPVNSCKNSPGKIMITINRLFASSIYIILYVANFQDSKHLHDPLFFGVFPEPYVN
jgi:hypothetical protein